MRADRKAARSFPTACHRERIVILPACREEARASFPLRPTGPYRFGGAAFADRLAASRDYEHPRLRPCERGRRIRRTSRQTATAAGTRDCFKTCS